MTKGRTVAPEDNRKVTIAAIARLAGVSVPTVSRVINGRSDVSPQTRERVEELLTRLEAGVLVLHSGPSPSMMVGSI